MRSKGLANLPLPSLYFDPDTNQARLDAPLRVPFTEG